MERRLKNQNSGSLSHLCAACSLLSKGGSERETGAGYHPESAPAYSLQLLLQDFEWKAYPIKRDLVLVSLAAYEEMESRLPIASLCQKRASRQTMRKNDDRQKAMDISGRRFNTHNTSLPSLLPLFKLTIHFGYVCVCM